MRRQINVWCIAAFAFTIFMTNSCKPNLSTSSRSVVEVALEKSGGRDRVQTEAEELFTRFGDTHIKLLYNSELTNSPALTQLASSLSGQILGIWPAGADEISVPAHFRIRFGTHSHYQFVLIFGARSVVSTNVGFVYITSNIYLMQ